MTGLAALVACSSEENLTQPGADETSPLAPALLLARNSWTTKAPDNLGVFAAAAGAAPNAAGNWTVYKFGGRDGSGNTSEPVEAYDVESDSWSLKNSRLNVFSTNGVAKIGSRLYLSGGSPEVASPAEYTNRVWAYDYAHDRLIQRADLPIASGEGVSEAIAGKLYVLPGVCSGELYPQPGYCAEERTERFYSYDPATNTWTPRASSPHFHRLGASGVIDGKMYVAAGLRDFTSVAKLDVYDPVSNTWSTLAPVPSGGHAIGAVVQGRFYVITGGGTYAYNPKTNTWDAKASPSQAHDAVLRVDLSGAARLLAVGGSHGPESDVPNNSELYTP